MFKLPRTNQRPRFTAVVAGERSRAFALERRFVVISQVRDGNRMRVTAQVVGGQRGAKVTIRRQVTCARSTPYRTIKLGRNGRFTLSLPLPSAAEGVAYFRARARIGIRTTFTLPIAVTRTG